MATIRRKLRKGDDVMFIETLEDGTFKIISNQISAINHTNAEGLQAELVSRMGGEAEYERRTDVEFEEEHSHDDEFHSH